jgi:hypothetical protein
MRIFHMFRPNYSSEKFADDMIHKTKSNVFNIGLTNAV